MPQNPQQLPATQPPPAGSPASLSAGAAAHALAEGTLTATALCEDLLGREAELRHLHAFSWLDAGDVLRQAAAVDRARSQGVRLGPLAGLPVAVKDNIATPGYPTSAGTATLRGFQAGSPSPVWARLAAQGAILFGKTNMHELACGGTSSNPVFGTVRNPHDLSRIPGGSSGGAAAAVAAHLVPLALGTDTSGSVRMPAALCGVAGLRPTTGPLRAYPGEGVVPLVRFVDTIGPMARDADDIALLHAAIVGRAPGQVPAAGALRVGIPRAAFWSDLQGEVAQAAEAALSLWARAGVTLVPVDIGTLAQQAVQLQQAWGASRRLRDLADYLREEGAGVTLEQLLEGIASADVRHVYALTGLPGESDDGLLASFDRLRADYARAWDAAGLHALAYPASPVTAPLIREEGDRFEDGMVLNGREVNTSAATSRHARFAAGLGVPAISVPCGTAGRLPVGLELAGLPGGDDALVAAARALGRLCRPTA